MTEQASLQETRALCRGSETCDPLYDTQDPAAEARLLDVDGALLLPGTSEQDGDGTSYASDLRITPHQQGWRLEYRDPEGASEGSYGREWSDAGVFAYWDDLVAFAYSL